MLHAIQTPESYFEKTKVFLENKPASHALASYIKENIDIGIFIGKSCQCSYFRQGTVPKLELRTPSSPDVIFHFKPEAIDSLLKTQGTELGTLVADVAKLYLAGLVRITLPGPIPLLLIRGYARVVKESRKQLLELLKDHGLDNLKFLSVIQRIKSQK